MNDLLTIDSILDYCDEPILFTARDCYETLYLCMMVQDSAPQYVSIKISPSRLCELEDKKLDLRSLFLYPETAEEYFLLSLSDDHLIKENGPHKLKEEFLPDEGYYLSGQELEKLTVTIPKKDYGLFKSIIHRFGWVAM